ncbi:hypothetical protein [Fibrobacter sp.]
MKSWLYSILFGLLLSSNAFAAYVAVLETVADERAKDSVSLPDRQYLTNVLREQAVKELPATQNYTIMTRDNINAMLPPGIVLEECEGSCLAETGRNISADYICQARVGRFGGMLTMTAELYETAGNKLIASFNGRGADVNELLEIIEQKSSEFFRSVREVNETANATATAEPVVADTAKPVAQEAPAEETKPAKPEPVATVEAPKDNSVAQAGESIPTNIEAKGGGAGRWIFLGVGTAAAVTGGILAYIGNKKAKDAAEDGGDGYSDSDLLDNRKKAESGQTMRGIGIAVMAVGVVGIGVSFFF